MTKSMKSVAIVLAMMLMLTVLAACGNNNNEGPAENKNGGTNGTNENAPVEEEKEELYENGLPKDEITLKLGYKQGGYGREWLDEAVASFTEKFPNVTFEITSSPDLGTILNAKAAANDDEDMFDIFSPQLSNGQSIIEQGRIASLESLWDRELYDTPGVTVKEAVPDGLYEDRPVVHEGESYEMPMGTFATGLFFDRVLFEEHGWNQNPRTFDEFIALLEDIQEDDIIPMTYPGVYPGYLTDNFGFIKALELAQINGTLDQVMENYKYSKTPFYTQPEVKEVWNKIYEMGQKGFFPNGVAALNHTQSQMQVVQHKAALIPNGDWIQNEMKDSTPEGFKWGYMSLPMGDDPESTKWIYSGPGATNFWVWEGKPELNKQWAKEFILWQYNMEVQAYNAVNAAILPIRQDLVNDPDLLESLQDAQKSLLEYMDNNKTRIFAMKREQTLDHPGFVQAGKILQEAVTNITLGKQDPEEILKKAEKALQEAVDAQK